MIVSVIEKMIRCIFCQHPIHADSHGFPLKVCSAKGLVCTVQYSKVQNIGNILCTQQQGIETSPKPLGTAFSFCLHVIHQWNTAAAVNMVEQLHHMKSVC